MSEKENKPKDENKPKREKTGCKNYIAYFLCFLALLALYEFLCDQIITAFSLGATGFILLIYPINKPNEEYKKHFLYRIFLKNKKDKGIDLYDILKTLGGYIFGITWGFLFSLIILNCNITLIYNGIDVVKVLSATIATTLTAFCMEKTESPHPPAAAFTLGLVMSATEGTFKSLVLSIALSTGFVILMCVIRYGFDKCAIIKQANKPTE